MSKNKYSWLSTLFSMVLIVTFGFSAPPQPILASTDDNTGYEPENPGVQPEQTAEGDYGMVVTAHPLASKIGAEVLKKGGNAVDAAVAIQFALNVVEPMMSGIGGGGFFMYYDANKKDVSIINSRERAPSGATPDMFMDKSQVVEGKGKFLIGANELNNNGGEQFHIGEVHVNDLSSNQNMFTYHFEGDEGEWNPEKFQVFERGTTLTLDQDGGSIHFGSEKADGEKKSFAQAVSVMDEIAEGELLIRFRTDDPGDDRRIRLWLRADEFQSANTTFVKNGYGIEIDTKANEVKLIQSKGSNNTTLQKYKVEQSTDWQWLRFQVANNKLKVRTWNHHLEEPEKWNIDTMMGTVIPFSERVQSGLSVGVPGTLKGLEAALNQWGTMSVAELISPAIKLAKDGVKVNWAVAAAISSNQDKLSQGAAKDVFLPGGQPLKEGDLLIQKDLARTFTLIKEHGTDVFYKGEIADAIAKIVQKNGGSMAPGDVHKYAVSYHKPVWGDYLGYDIASMPPPSSGGLTALQILKMYEKMDMTKYGVRSPEKYHYMAEITRLAYADRAAYMGDPEYVDVPEKGLLSENYIDKRIKTIQSDNANSEIQQGDPWEYQDKGTAMTIDQSNEQQDDKVDGETTHFTVADRWGNFVSFTTTIEQLFGSGIMVPDYGIVLNNELTDFDATPGGANEVQANKRPLSSMTPTIVLKDGKPFMTVGSPGGTTIITSVAQTILNVIGYKMDLKDAIEEPRIFTNSFPTIRWEYGIPSNAREKLQRRGHKWEPAPKEIGNVNSIIVDEKRNLFIGAADSTREGSAIGLSAQDFIDKSGLQKAIDKVKAEKRDTSAYTKASWKAFRDALRHAESILHDEQATQDDINKALQVLNSAREGLELLGEEKEELKPGKKDTTDAGESKLPNTATNIFNWFIVGLVLFLVGGLLIYRHRK